MEIGSDFWKAEQKDKDIRFFLSGRTALEYIIRDILSENAFDSALLPSYCCHTMIEPFVRNGVSVRFYDVYVQEGRLLTELPEPKKREIFFLIKYFGYGRLPGLEPKRIRSQWDCIIEDRTHSWLTETADAGCADYGFTSYRKWTGTGGIAAAEKEGAHFRIKSPGRRNKEYEKRILSAEQLKKRYIEENRGHKEEYLKLFQEAEECLAEDYADCAPGCESISRLLKLDIKLIKEKRRANAETLLGCLRNIEGITPMACAVEPGDTPLFVPVLTDPDKRELLRSYLIEKQIYCPIHWPLSCLHEISERGREIYDRELSLICDQRYGEGEMVRIGEVIEGFFENKN